jgi:hypothetical protein
MASSRKPWERYSYPGIKLGPGASDWSDLNDPDKLSQAIARMNIRANYRTGERDFRLPNHDGLIFQYAPSCVPPDVPPNTRIVAVCCIPQEDASPNVDGWFVSDFMAMYHLFQGLTEHQTWMHVLDLEKLVTQDSEYLHGNPYGNRKIVLDASILAKIGPGKPMRAFTTPTQRAHLDRDFKNEVARQCKEAEKNNDPVLIMIFTHGHDSFRFAFPGRSKLLWLKPETLVKSLNVNKGVKVGLITTACYSGGWVAKVDLKKPNLPLNITSMTAAGEEQKSRSWRWSASIGRYCGSMFVSALVETLTRDSRTQKPLRQMVEGEEGDSDGDILTDDQDMSLAEFDRTLYLTLLDLDRRGYEHNITFTAQNNSWSENFEGRVGIPLGALQDRWSSLKNWPASPTLHPGDHLNRDPHVSQEKREEFIRYFKEYRNSGAWKKPIDRLLEREGVANKRTLSLMMRGSRSLESWVRRRIQLYRKSNPGEDDLGGNQGLGTLMREAENYGQDGTASVETLDRTLRIIDYRLEVMRMADNYVEALGIDGPGKKCCAEWNREEWVAENGNHKNPSLFQVSCIISNVDHFKLFPIPSKGLGPEYGKGYSYVKAALFCAAKYQNWSLDRVNEALEELIQQVKEELVATKEIVKDLAEIKSKRQKVAEAFKRTLRDLSPMRSQPENRPLGHRPRLSTGTPPFLGNPTSASTPPSNTPGNRWVPQGSSQGGSSSHRISPSAPGQQHGTPPRFNPSGSKSNSPSEQVNPLGQQSPPAGQLTGSPVLRPRGGGNQGEYRSRGRGSGRGRGGDGRGS